MKTVCEQIRNASDAICQNIDSLDGQRGLLSQNILSQLRNLVEGVVVFIHLKSVDVSFNYEDIQPAINFVKTNAKYNFLSRFHKLLQRSTSHYTLDGDSSERLMLKYYEYLHRIRNMLKEEGLDVLGNLEKFPIDLDPQLQEYYQKIAERVELAKSTKIDKSSEERYYIHKKRPFFVGGKIYYEVTFYRAINKANKFDRVIAFTHIDMTDKYAAILTLKQDSFEVLEQIMPIMIILEWRVSIRPCEFQSFSRLFGRDIEVNITSAEYKYLMRLLTSSMGNLIDIVELNDDDYENVKLNGGSRGSKVILFPLLDEARYIIKNNHPGSNVLRYLMLRMNNQILKAQYNRDRCKDLSGLCLKYGCIPFDTMPFCTSLPEHNPRYWDLVESLDTAGRDHELMARRVLNNVECYGMLYTPQSDLQSFEDVNKLIGLYNQRLYYKHNHRKLSAYKAHVFIQGYEDDTVSIIKKIKEYAASGIGGYTESMERWLNEQPSEIDDPFKREALRNLFSHSRVALIYGAAGTGKSTMVDLIARYFNEKKKLFLAHTNPAIDNLKRKVTARNSEFLTISSHISRKVRQEFDILVVDECSTVSNKNLLKILEKTSFELLVLVGDVYQIEAIEFGNWFKIINSFLPENSTFELKTPFRTKNEELLTFWSKVRMVEADIAETMAHNGYSAVLGKQLFEAKGKDEIVLCLNYDGLYGINNINRFLQSGNPSPEVFWREAVYKIGDPVLFHEAERFRPVIFNNLKGRIVDIKKKPWQIEFDVELDRHLNELDVKNDELKWVRESVVRFSVYDSSRASDEDDDSLNTIVPFQVSYAVSIHKAQGLEYDSVKIVITDANEEDVTHNIFYTAITRARERLLIFWTPETQQRILSRLKQKSNNKDVSLLIRRQNLIKLD